VRLLTPRRQQRWWLGMAHFYIAMNHLLTGEFDAALEAAARADEIGKDIGDPRLQTYAGFSSGWVEASRGNHEAAVALCRRSREQAPDRVSRAYASMIFGYALLGHGDHAQARLVLEPIVHELEGFGFPQWHAFASALAADACRLDGRFDTAKVFVDRAVEVATRARYWYGVGFAHRVGARLARDRGMLAEAAAALERAAGTFDRIGAAFESARTRGEMAALTTAG
jgi:tetratricopeptide (TPR) repeat protein